MKNRLEDEYRQLKQSETPDLWDRIEAGIDKSTNESAEYGKHKKAGGFFRKYSLPLAACIAAVLCVPLIAAGFLKIVGGGNMFTADADVAAEEENFAVTAESYEEAAYDVASAENAAEEVAMAEDAAADDGGVTEDNSASGSSDAAPDSETEKQSGKEQSLQDLEEPFDSCQQTLTVTGYSSEKGIFSEERKEGTIYTVTTVEQGECSVFVPADAVFNLLLNQSVRIVVEPGNGEYDYLFVRMAE